MGILARIILFIVLLSGFASGFVFGQTLTCAGDATKDTDSEKCFYTPSGGEFDPVFVGLDPPESISYILSDATLGFDLSFLASPSLSLDGVTFNVGTTTVVWRYQRMSSPPFDINCSFTVTVTDNEKPALFGCPGDINVGTDASMCNAVVNWSEPTAIDNCDGSLSFDSRSHSPGTSFPIGTTTVTYTFEDSEENISECNFDVTVTDNESPVITGCVLDKDIYLNSDCEFTLSDYTGDPGLAFTDCTPVTRTQIPASGTVINDTTTVTVELEDAYGNKSSCDFSINTLDTIKPVISSCAPDTNVYLGADCKYTLPDYRSEASIAECSAVTLSQVPSAGAEISDTTQVTITVTDEYGNIRSCNFMVNTIDTVKPVINSCAPDTNVYLDADCKYTLPDYRGEASITECSAVTLSQVPSAGAEISDTTQVTITATDEYGNIRSCSFMVNTIDTIKPVINSCAPDTNVYLDADCKYTLPDYRGEASITECSAVTLSQAPSAGAEISDTTQVTITATDEYGNIRSCNFMVNTIDTIKPVINSCAPDTNVYFDADCKYTLSDYRGEASITECSAVTLSQVPSAGTAIFDTTQVTIMATDEYGNTRSCLFMVNTVDTIKPNAIAKSSLALSIDHELGIATIGVNDIDNGSTDNCSVQNRFIDVSTFDCNDIGSTIPVTLSVVDEFGNISKAVTNVTITGYDIEPVISINMMNDTTLCTEEFIDIELSSNIDSTTYSWEFNSSESVSGWDNDTIDYPPNGDYTLSQQILNSSDSVKVVSVSIQTKLFKKCNLPRFDTTLNFLLVPELFADLEPATDTICNGEAASVEIKSINYSESLRFRYKILPEQTDSVDIKWVNANDTLDRTKGFIIKDTLVNKSKSAQLVNIIAIPYIKKGSAPGDYYCMGESDTARVWIEPIPNLSVTISDTIFCDSSEVNIQVADLFGNTKGVKAYQLYTTNAGGAVTGIQASGLYSIGNNVTDTLVNHTNKVQVVTYRFVGAIDGSGGLCNNGTDTTITVYVNPTPRLGVSISDTIFCDSSTVDISVTDLLLGVEGTKVYELTTSYSAGQVEGVQLSGEYLAGQNIRDTLVNLSNEVQMVTYHFKARISDPRGDGSVPYCDQGKDTTITVYVNPTPRLGVSISDTIFCDSSTVDISVTDLLLGVEGTKVYELTTSYSAGQVEGVQLSGIYTAGQNIRDTLVNLSNEVQMVTYHFKARISDPRGDGSVPYCDQGKDTTITVYVNPTPRLGVSISDTIFCDSSTVDISVTDLLLGVEGTKVYELTTSYSAGQVEGVQFSGEYLAGQNIRDTLVNLSTEVQMVTYHFKARISDPRGDGSVPYCDQGKDTTITVYVNPTPKLGVSISDTIFCDSSTVDISVTDLLLGVEGTKVYELTTSYSAGQVEGVQLSGIYTAGQNIRDTLVNLSTEVQMVTYHFKARISDPRGDGSLAYCSQGGDTSITVYVNPTPRLGVNISDTIFCDSSTVDISVTDLLLGVEGTKVYELTTSYSAGQVEGVQLSGEYLAGQNIRDTLVNLSNEVQMVTYHFKARISDPRGDGSVPYCDQGKDTTITVYVNPTPRLGVSISDTIFCDSSTVDISVTDLLLGVEGTKVYELTTSYSAGQVGGVQLSGIYTAGQNIRDTLVNLSTEVQMVTYHFKARISDPRGDGSLAYCSQGGDTSITVYVNPTPRLGVSISDTIFCDSSTVDISVTDLLLGVEGTKVYELTTSYSAGQVEGVQLSGEYLAGQNIRDTLVNLSNEVQMVTYHFKARISDPRGDGSVPYCDQGKDTTITVYVNPTPRLGVSISDTIFCDSSTVDISVTDLLLGVEGTKVYELTTSYSAGQVEGVQLSGEYLAGQNIRDTLVNLSAEVQMVTYHFKARISDPRGDGSVAYCSQGGDTSITVYVNPTPRLGVSISDTIFCDSSTVDISVTDLLLGVEGTKVYELATSYSAGQVEGVQLSGEYLAGQNIRDTLVNLSNEVQMVTYHFKARISDPRGDGSVPYCDQGKDTTITVYVNPTPRLGVGISDTIFCDSSTVDISVTDLLLGVEGTKVYELTTSYSAGQVEGVQLSGEYLAGQNIRDTLVNLSAEVQMVTYHFKARISDPRGDGSVPYCDQGKDTTITVYVNPTPRLGVSISDTIFCDSSTVDISVTDLLLGVEGTKVYELTTSYSAGQVEGVQLSGIYTAGQNIRDTLVNLSAEVQMVTYHFKARISDPRGDGSVPYCDQGKDTTITVYVNPTPRLGVSISDTIFCDSSTVDISVTDLLLGVEGTKVYELTTSYSAGQVEGVQLSGIYTAGQNIRDTLVNLSTEVQMVTYHFKARISDPRGDGSVAYCSQGGDTSITVYVNPTPKLSVSISDTIFCDSSTVDISVTDLLLGVEGTKVYELTTSYSTGQVEGVQLSGIYTAGQNIRDTLVNLSNEFQVVTYHFKARISDPRGDGSVAYCSQGTDTLIKVYLEPTAKVHFDHYEDTICTGLNYAPLSILTVTQPIFDVRFDYQIVPRNPSLVNSKVGTNSNLTKGTIISDTLVNLSDTIQEVLVVVTPYLIDGSGSPSCSGIKDTVVIQLTPALVMQDSARKYVKYNIDCKGNSSGAIYMYPYGGILAFGNKYDNRDLSYNISGPGIGGTLYDSLASDVYKVGSLIAGKYGLGVSDFSGCTSTDTITLSEPEDPLKVEIVEVVSIVCDGSSGVLTARKSGGTFFVSGTDTTGYGTSIWRIRRFGWPIQTIIKDTINPPGGEFQVYIEDTNGCSARESRVIEGLGTPAVDEFEPKSSYGNYNISCTGAADGELNVVAKSDVHLDTFYYFLYNRDSTVTRNSSSEFDEIAWNDLPAGEYRVVVANEQNCLSEPSSTVILSEPPDSLRIHKHKIIRSWYNQNWNVSCNQAEDGLIKLDSVSGGRPLDYSFEWYKDGAVYNNKKDLDSLGFGQYKVIVTDGHCYDSADVEILAPKLLEFESILPSNNLCNGDSTGRIEVKVRGGEVSGEDYIYSWSHNASLNSNIAENLFFGEYTVNVKDSIGCGIESTVPITQPEPLIINKTFSDYNGFNVGCYGDASGQITVDVLGGVGNRTYNWENEGNLISGTDNISGLKAGNYKLTVYDDNNCEETESFVLTQPEPVEIDFEVKDKVCKVLGEAVAVVSGGVRNSDGYSYYWPSLGTTLAGIQEIMPGQYILEVTDKNNCLKIDTVNIGERNKMTIALSEEIPITCNGYDDGALSVFMQDATPPLQILWNGNEGGEILNNISPGRYIIEVEDKNKCRALDSLDVMQPQPVKADFIVGNASCNDTADGKISFGANGGNGDYQFEFDGIWYEESEMADLLHAGEYPVKIVDEKGCNVDTVITILEPDKLQLIENYVEKIKPSCPDSPDGKLVVEASGGTQPYSINWLNDDIQGEVLDGINEGYYRVRVVDDNNCVEERRLYMEPDLPACLDIPSAYSPNNDSHNDFWDIVNPLNQDMDLTFIYPKMLVKIYNRWGQMVWISKRGYPRGSAWNGMDNNGRSLPVDSYHYIIYLNNNTGRTMRGIVTLVK